MFTRCPGCHTVHPVNAALLAAAGGRYRCGKCGKANDALEALFDAWPGSAERPAPRGEAPTLGLPIDLEEAARSREAPEGSGLDEEANAALRPQGRGPWLRISWIAAAIVMVGLIALEIAEFQGRPLLERPGVERLLIRLGLRDEPPPEVFRDLEQIHLVSRELRSHPSRPGRLQLNATIVNRAGRAQPYPAMEVSLLDASGQVLSKRLFQPGDYLAPGDRAGSVMAPRAYLPLSLEMEDPGDRAVGFELEFR